MPFVPATSIESAGGGGLVTVTNFPADQLVHFTQPISVTGPMTDAEFAAHLPLAVTGPLTNAQLLAAEPLSVTGPLTDAQLAARLPLAVAGAVTVASLPLPVGAATEETAERIADSLDDVGLTAILQREKVTE